MNFPRSLIEWNYSVIQELIDNGYEETDLFDFKYDLQPIEKHQKIISAFANTNGGFLIYGIRDKKKSNRIVGIDKNKEFIKEFQDKSNGIDPVPLFEFKQPSILIPNSENVIHVCYIPKSLERPHLTKEKLFFKRTNGGSCERMSYNDVRESFLSYEQRITKLSLLGLELGYIRYSLNKLYSVKEVVKKPTIIPFFKVDLSLLINLIGEIYPLTKDNQIFTFKLLNIRKKFEEINNLISLHQGFFLERNVKQVKNAENMILLITSELDKLIGEALSILKIDFNTDIKETDKFNEGMDYFEYFSEDYEKKFENKKKK